MQQKALPEQAFLGWARRFRTCDLSRAKNEETQDPEAKDEP
jgi:hypothetical protein